MISFSVLSWEEEEEHVREAMKWSGISPVSAGSEEEAWDWVWD